MVHKLARGARHAVYCVRSGFHILVLASVPLTGLSPPVIAQQPLMTVTTTTGMLFFKQLYNRLLPHRKSRAREPSNSDPNHAVSPSTALSGRTVSTVYIHLEPLSRSSYTLLPLARTHQRVLKFLLQSYSHSGLVLDESPTDAIFGVVRIERNRMPKAEEASRRRAVPITAP